MGTSTADIPNSNRLDFANNTMIYPESESFGGYVGVNRTLRGGVTAFGRRRSRRRGACD